MDLDLSKTDTEFINNYITSLNDVDKNTLADGNMICNYIKSLNPIERKALYIAKDMLQSSFSIEKSIGFIEWKKSYDISITK